MKKILTTIILILPLFYGINQSFAQVNESSLWGPNGKNWNPAGRLPDFSYAGYHSSEKDIPTLPVVYNLSNNSITGTQAKPNDGLDDSKFLQQLINATTGGGVILIPAGRWNMDSDIIMKTDGLVIRGAVDAKGVPTTEFYQASPRFPTPKTSGSVTTGIITIQGNQSFSAEIGKVSVDASQGSTTLTLTNVGNLIKGDFIRIIQYDPADTSLANFLTGNVYQGSETANQKDKCRIFAKIASVSGKTITLDRPIPFPAKVKWSPTITKFDINNFK